VSARKKVPRGSTRALSAAGAVTPGRKPMTLITSRRCGRYGPKLPQIMASASCFCTISAAITVLLVRTAVRATSGDTPRRASSWW
jgi:hypothetical protein